MTKLAKLTFGMLLFLITAIGYPDYYPLPQITTEVISRILSVIIGVKVLTYGNVLFLNMGGNLSMISISSECSGFILMSVFLWVMFLIPGIKLKHRLAAVLLVPLIYMANILRILLTICIGIYTNVNIMLLIHDTIGQVFLLLFTLFIFVFFLVKTQYIRLKKTTSGGRIHD